MDEEFNEVLATLDTEESTDEPVLPEGFSVTEVLQSIKPTGDLVTAKQKDVHKIISTLTLSSMQQITQFCKKTFTAMNEIIEEMNITEPMSVKPDVITTFYSKSHTFQTSAQYRLNCSLCFKDVNTITEAHWYIAYKLTVAVRKYILSEKEKMFPTSDRPISNRDITEASRARIRYVGGYCINKIRQEHLSVAKRNMYSKSVHGQIQYEKSCEMLKVINNFREEEEHLKATTVDPNSLFDTIRRQYVNKGLTHISDDLYHFFVRLCEKCLEVLVDKNLNETNDTLYEYSLKQLIGSEELLELLLKACKFDKELSSGQILACQYVAPAVHAAMEYMLNTLEANQVAEYLLERLTKSFLLVMLVQFKNDLLQSFKISKSMEHRKQIQTKKSTDKAPVKALSYTDILEDHTENRKMSHSLLQGLLMRHLPVLQPMIKTQLQQLCKAYAVRGYTKMKKSDIIESLSKRILEASEMVQPAVFDTHHRRQLPTDDPQPCMSSTTDVP